MRYVNDDIKWLVKFMLSKIEKSISYLFIILLFLEIDNVITCYKN